MLTDVIKLANLPDGCAASVIVNGVTVYHEDDDKGLTMFKFLGKLGEALKLARPSNDGERAKLDAMLNRYHQNFTAEEVAERLAKAFNTQYSKITLAWEDIEGGAEEWNFDDVENAVNAGKGVLDIVFCSVK